MVYIKRVELTHFKSFGGTTSVPLLPGFTVISGPNGSGKSNILDALLFCLGLASSKGMRAERLPDLVNHNQPHKGTVEASVTVTFDLGDYHQEKMVEETGEATSEHSLSRISNLQSDWSVTRRLRVTKQGTYTSTYYINGETCNLTELHEQLNELRIYPEGYNVVLQGDVTSIISMNSRERREIIDELAGVAAFDRKIVQAKDTLNSVKEREDSCRIVEKELAAQRDRLSQDRIKAEKYQKLRAELQEKQVWEAVLVWQSLQKQEWQLREQIENGDREQASLTEQLTSLTAQIHQQAAELDSLNAAVKALGEEQLLALQATLATQSAEKKQVKRQVEEVTGAIQQALSHVQKAEEEIQEYQQTITANISRLETTTLQVTQQRQQQEQLQHRLTQDREKANAIAAASEAWVQQQAALSRQVDNLLQTIDPQRAEQAQLQERFRQLNKQIADQNQLLARLAGEITEKQVQIGDLETLQATSLQPIETLTKSLAAAEQELQLQQETQKRLLGEQREKQRQLDKLEAQNQAQQEIQGTYATKILLQAGLPGICGLVAQLGRVEPRYQLALETAAGARLGYLVVEDDGVGAAGIELLKQKRAGRVTFLPLNKIRPGQFTPTVALRYAEGFVGWAVNLIECDRQYQDIFAYVFGNTVVFENLTKARPFLGQQRIVTLEGELLETSGAMTGGSSNQRSGLRFETGDPAESAEMTALKNRLQEIEQILERCGNHIAALTAKIKQTSPELQEAKQQRRETQLQLEQWQKELKNLIAQQEQGQSLLNQNHQELATATQRLQVLETDLPIQETQLQQYRQALAELEQSQTHSEWQQIQAEIKLQETELRRQEQIWRSQEQQLKDLENQQQRLQEKIQQAQERVQEYQQQSHQGREQELTLKTQLAVIDAQISDTQLAITQAEANLGQAKIDRDKLEAQVRDRRLQHQQLEWQGQKLQETQLNRREELTNLRTQMQAQQTELPDPLPAVPETVKLEQLQQETRSLQKRLQAMEPVNMLALEEYERTQNRLEELTQKLATLEAERTELLLRIENFTTLRFRAFKEAFDAVNQNFQTIFAELSEGDGYLQLDDPQDPFNGGLNLVAHPKGKPVQRLASMSGGEKSLTALSFIFALQRYRPSPFYAFDEVDMFLDGANVERLARMIEQQAQQAQFIVVSLRRPMIESAQRTIGVTQARGAYTQVLGIQLQPRSASR